MSFVREPGVQMKTTILRDIFLVLFLSLTLFSWSIKGDDSHQVDIRINDDSGSLSETWIGVFDEKLDTLTNPSEWISETENVFSLSLPKNREETTLIFLQKDKVPVVIPVTLELIADGLDLDFSEGSVITGVVTTTAGEPIDDGEVLLNPYHEFDFHLPDPSLARWEVEDDGSFEIKGLRSGSYTVTAKAPGFMRASTEIEFVSTDQKQELNFQLPRAGYISGQMIDVYYTKVRGKIDVLVTPPESQTEEISTEFDRDDNFRIGPFAEGVTVELTVTDTESRRSRPHTFQVPTDKVYVVLHRWVKLTGTVEDHDTGEPVEKFQFWTDSELRGMLPTEVSAPNGRFEWEVAELIQRISIVAPEYLWWGMSYMKLESKEVFDLGVIKLRPAHTVRGRVIKIPSGEPIKGVGIRSIAVHEGSVSNWAFNNVVTITDADGEFELQGVPATGGLIQINATGYQSLTIPIKDPKTYQEIEMSVETHTMGSISGLVMSLEGQPVHPAYVRLGGYFSRNNEDGSFSFQKVPRRYRLSAEAAHGKSKVIEGTVEPGEHITNVKLIISEVGGKVHGNVQGLLDGETANVVVSRKHSTFPILKSDGPYEVQGVPIGEQTVKCITYFERAYFRELSGTIVMDETMDASIDFIFAGKSSVTGFVTAGGEPVPLVEVRAEPVDEAHTSSYAITTGEGRYVIVGLNEGNYRIILVDRGVRRNVSVAGESTLDIELGTNTLSGYVQSSESVLGVRVYLFGSGEYGDKVELMTTVDASGYYHLSGMPNGSYTLRTSHEKFEEYETEVKIRKARHDFDIVLKPSGADKLEQDLESLEAIGW